MPGARIEPGLEQMIPAAQFTLRIALVAAIAVFMLTAAQRFAAWRLPQYVVAALSATTLLPVVWRFFELSAVMGEAGPWPMLRLGLVLAPLIQLGCAVGVVGLRQTHPVLNAGVPLVALLLLFLLRALVMSQAPGSAGPDDPMLWLMTGSIVLLASLGLLLVREINDGAGSGISRPDC